MDKTLLKRLERGIEIFSGADKKIAQYVVVNSSEAIHMSVAELAEKTDVSVASIVRFARKMGADGFADFKIRLSAALTTDTETVEDISDIQNSDGIDTIFTKLCAYASKSIRDTHQLIDMDALEGSIAAIAATRRNRGKIYVLGVGASAPLAMQAHLELSFLNYNAVLFSDLYLNIESMILNISENDVLLCISTQGKSSITHKAIEIAHKASAKTILISQFVTDYLGEEDTITLLTSNAAGDYQLINTTALVTEGIVIHALYYGLAIRDYDNEIARMNRLFEGVKEVGL